MDNWILQIFSLIAGSIIVSYVCLLYFRKPEGSDAREFVEEMDADGEKSELERQQHEAEYQAAVEVSNSQITELDEGIQETIDKREKLGQKIEELKEKEGKISADEIEKTLEENGFTVEDF